MRIHRSPSPLVNVAHFDPAHHRVSPPADMDDDFVVLENTSDKAIVAITAMWEYTDPAGHPQKIMLTSDGFSGTGAAQIVAPHSITFLGQQQVIPEATAAHAARGGGYSGPGKQRELPGEKTLTIDAIVFEDGEITGPDTNQLAIQLPARKAAALRVATAMRQAMATHTDITQAMDGLIAERPEPTPESVTEYNARIRYADQIKSMYSPAMHARLGNADPSDFANGFLRHLESMPQPPKMFRKEQPINNKETL